MVPGGGLSLAIVGRCLRSIVEGETVVRMKIRPPRPRSLGKRWTGGRAGRARPAAVNGGDYTDRREQRHRVRRLGGAGAGHGLTAMGDTVNVAARLASAAGSGRNSPHPRCRAGGRRRSRRPRATRSSNSRARVRGHRSSCCASSWGLRDRCGLACENGRYAKQSEPSATPYRNLGPIRSARSGVETPWRFDAR